MYKTKRENCEKFLRFSSHSVCLLFLESKTKVYVIDAVTGRLLNRIETRTCLFLVTVHNNYKCPLWDSCIIVKSTMVCFVRESHTSSSLR